MLIKLHYTLQGQKDLFYASRHRFQNPSTREALTAGHSNLGHSKLDYNLQLKTIQSRYRIQVSNRCETNKGSNWPVVQEVLSMNIDFQTNIWTAIDSQLVQRMDLFLFAVWIIRMTFQCGLCKFTIRMSCSRRSSLDINCRLRHYHLLV